MERNICNETFLFHKYWQWNGEICIDNIGLCMVYCILVLEHVPDEKLSN